MKKTFSAISVVTLLINLIIVISIILNNNLGFLDNIYFKIMTMISFYSILCLCSANIIEKRNATIFSIICIIIILFCFGFELVNIFGFGTLWPNVFSLETISKISTTTIVLPLAIAIISLILSITNNSKIVNLFVFLSSVSTSMFFLILFIFVWKSNQIIDITNILVLDNYKILLIFLSLASFSSAIMIILNGAIKNTDITEIMQDKDPFNTTNSFNNQNVKVENKDIFENNIMKSDLIDTPVFIPEINKPIEDVQIVDVN